MDNSVYVKRRQNFSRSLSAGSIAFIPGAKITYRNSDVEHTFRQESNLLYLTGFSEPDALLVITGGMQGGSILFSRPKDKEREIWSGKRLGQDGAIKDLLVDNAYSSLDIKKAARAIEGLLNGRMVVFCPTKAGRDNGFLPLIPIIDRYRKKCGYPLVLADIDDAIGEFRLIKTKVEIATMRKGISVSAHMHHEILAMVCPEMREYELEAEISYLLRKNGSDRLLAYPPIVASGRNALTLHHTENNGTLNDGDLVLVDAGGEFDGYAADITRTFPVNGTFSPAQRTLYEIVLTAQKTAIDKIWPGLAFFEVHNAAMISLCEGLLRIGFIKADNARKAFEDEMHKRFMPHGTSHWLGLDVHDSGNYERNKDKLPMRKLEPGMVLTVEPGIYINEDPSIPKEYWGIGIRIEDDILVTETGADVLSYQAPKEISEIEDAMLGTRFY